MRYLRELHAGDPVRVTFQLLDYDAKRMHYFEQLFHAEEGWVSATSENMTLHVDMDATQDRALPDDVARSSRPDEGRACAPAACPRRRAAASRCARSPDRAVCRACRGFPSQIAGGRCHFVAVRIMGTCALADPSRETRDPAASTGAGAGRHRARGRERRRRGARYLAGLNPEQRHAVETLGRPGAGARRRRHRQDARAHHAHRPHPRLGRARPCEILAVTFTNKAAREMKHRVGEMVGRRRRGHAVARHLPLDRREDPAPPCRAGRPQARFHHPRRRRPDPAAQAAPRGREHRREALAGARARDADRRLEEPRAHARSRCRPGEAGALRQRQGAQALQGAIRSG